MSDMLGTVISGSLQEGLLVRFASHVRLADISTGTFMCIRTQNSTFVCVVADLSLATSSPEIAQRPPVSASSLLARTLSGYDVYATALLKPLVCLNLQSIPMPVKTLPDHFSPVYYASAEDIAHIFGSEQDTQKTYFSIGTPLDMNVPVCIDLAKLSERSNGIFGKTGTGKTFITRLVLAGLIKHEQAVNIIFDMHSEYGLQARTEQGGGSFVKGLRTLFGAKVAIFSLDPISTRRRGAQPDVELKLTYQSISVEDILSLAHELNLHSTALEAAYLIHARYKRDWLAVLLAQDDIKTFATSIGAHPESVAALYRKLKRIERLPFFVPAQEPYSTQDHTVIDHMMEYISRGISIIIEFGNYTSTFAYLLIANIITRRIHAEYVERTELFLGTGLESDRPRQLMITIEEAHKFLNPAAARQTIFGTIAREMRKYYVSLLIVDQRPSGIDPEVLSQIGTKIIAQLNDERDIAAVLMGMPNSVHLRTILATLETKQQALVAGHAIAMPIVIKTRPYDTQFYSDIAPDIIPTTRQAIDQLY
ncbi:ATP-binding protein [Vermiphilus pyriformis]|nr:MAG: ATP-binding protein [Vermiphilus pyriformis]